MAEFQNPPNEFGAVDTGAAPSRRLRIRFKGPAPCPAPTPDGDQCLKPSLNACKSFKRKRVADNGIQTSSNAKRVARYEQETECGVGSNYAEAIQQKHFNLDTLCRLRRCDTATKGRKRSQSSLGLPTSSQLKRSKRSSSAERRASSINDLPDVVLVEILCRLPCNKLIFRCKSVSKRWRTLITDPYFIGCFVDIQSYKKTPRIRTLINLRGEEFPPKMSSSPKLLTPVLKRIKSFHRLKAQPVVVATYNDLILCCASEVYECDYYICNAYTMQWVALPPTPSHCHSFVRLGFICDFPDHNCERDDRKGHNIQLNAECRCTVVRILRPDKFAKDEKCDCFKLNVEIFSSETGQWRESIVSSPRYFDFNRLDDFSFAYKGMLYWPGARLSLIGLGPFFNNNRTSISSSSSNGDGIIDHELCFTVSEEPEVPIDKRMVVLYKGVFGGCVRMCYFCFASRNLYVWELKEEDHVQMVDGAAGNFCLSEHRVYSLDRKMYPDNPLRCMEAFDPNNKDILYLHVDGDIIKCNIHTGEWSKMVEKLPVISFYYFPVELPWWPTPVPRLLQHAHGHGGGGTSRW